MDRECQVPRERRQVEAVGLAAQRQVVVDVVQAAPADAPREAERGLSATAVRWRRTGGSDAALVVRPFLSGRDTHALHHANPAFRFDPTRAGAALERALTDPDSQVREKAAAALVLLGLTGR